MHNGEKNLKFFTEHNKQKDGHKDRKGNVHFA